MTRRERLDALADYWQSLAVGYDLSRQENTRRAGLLAAMMADDLGEARAVATPREAEAMGLGAPPPPVPREDREPGDDDVEDLAAGRTPEAPAPPPPRARMPVEAPEPSLFDPPAPRPGYPPSGWIGCLTSVDIAEKAIERAEETKTPPLKSASEPIFSGPERVA